MGNFSEYPGGLKDGREAALRDLTPPRRRPKAKRATEAARAPRTPSPADSDKSK